MPIFPKVAQFRGPLLLGARGFFVCHFSLKSVEGSGVGQWLRMFPGFRGSSKIGALSLLFWCRVGSSKVCLNLLLGGGVFGCGWPSRFSCGSLSFFPLFSKGEEPRFLIKGEGTHRRRTLLTRSFNRWVHGLNRVTPPVVG